VTAASKTTVTPPGSAAPARTSAAGHGAGKPASKAAAQSAPQTFSGHGDKVVRITQGNKPWLATFTHNGSANFIVDALGPDGQTSGSLVNEIGHYNGEVQLPDATFLITIHADGSWALTRG
jgi:hypothetical protein